MRHLWANIRRHAHEPEVTGGMSAFLGIWVTLYPPADDALKAGLVIAFGALFWASYRANSKQKENAENAEKAWRAEMQRKLDEIAERETVTLVRAEGNLTNPTVTSNTVNVFRNGIKQRADAEERTSEDPTPS